MNTIYLKSFFFVFYYREQTPNVPMDKDHEKRILYSENISHSQCNQSTPKHYNFYVHTRWTHVKKTKEKYEKMPTNQMQMFEVLLYACFRIKKMKCVYVCLRCRSTYRTIWMSFVVSSSLFFIWLFVQLPVRCCRVLHEF